MSDTKDEVKKAEKRGYSKGYNAGKRSTDSHTARIAELETEVTSLRQSFVQEVFLAALPAVIASGWKCGAENTADAKIQAAWYFAKNSIKHS